jgi:hypothetical protein
MVSGGGSTGSNDASLNYNAPNTFQFQSAVPGVSLAGGVQSSSAAFWLQVRSSNANGLNYGLLLNPLGGNVGIGTTNPATTLHVNGVITAASLAGPTGSGLTLITGAAYRVAIDVSGNVGIGTQTPQCLFHVGVGTVTAAPTVNTRFMVSDNVAGIVDAFICNYNSATVGQGCRIFMAPWNGFTSGQIPYLSCVCDNIGGVLGSAWVIGGFSQTLGGVELLRLNSQGQLKMPYMPTTNPGAGTKLLWCDTTDSNRVKFAV